METETGTPLFRKDQNNLLGELEFRPFIYMSLLHDVVNLHG